MSKQQHEPTEQEYAPGIAGGQSAHGIECSCGWVSVLALYRESARGEFLQHVLDEVCAEQFWPTDLYNVDF